MKKIIFACLAILAAYTSKAITVAEAFDSIAKLPGAAVSEMPDYDVAKDGLDWGKVVMLLGQPSDSVKAIVAEIVDVETVETSIGGQPTTIYIQAQEDGTALALSVTYTPAGPVAIYASGKENVSKAIGVD